MIRRHRVRDLADVLHAGDEIHTWPSLQHGSKPDQYQLSSVCLIVRFHCLADHE